MKTSCCIFTLFLLFSSALPSQTCQPEWRLETALKNPVTGHNAVMLPDGNILIAGGVNGSNSALADAQIYDFATNKVLPISPLNITRAYFSMVCVPIGPQSVRIFVIGGYTGNSGSFSSVAQVEALDYTVGSAVQSWQKVAVLNTGRGDCIATWDKSSSIIVTGGISQASGALRSGTVLSSAESIETSFPYLVSSAGIMEKARYGHLCATIINKNNANEVLVASGEIPQNTSTERLENNSWLTYANPPKEYRIFAAGFADYAGIARMFGGFDINGAPKNTCEWYDAQKQLWKYNANMLYARANSGLTHIAGLTDSVSQYLIAAGDGTSGKLASTEIFSMPDASNPSGAWQQFSPLNFAASDRQLTMCGSNLPVCIGGLAAGGAPLSAIEIFQPIQAADAVFPGSTEVGGLSDSIPITLINKWVLPVKLTAFRFADSDEFFLTGDTSNFVLQPGASRKIFAWFLPKTEGAATGKMLFNIAGIIDTVILKATAVRSSVGIITTAADFGEIFVGKDTLVCFPAIRNLGSDTTSIDSISVTLAPNYALVSPKGRVKLPPDSVLTICVRFAPIERLSLAGTALLHIGRSKFACGLNGKGIMSYIKGYGNKDCDTVFYTSGSNFPSVITLHNLGDRTVNVTGYTVMGGSSAQFSINPSIFPLDIQVGDQKQITVVFTPPSEGVFNVSIQFANDGNPDSTVIVPICFVARSKSAQLSVSSVDFGSLCTSDSVYTSIFIENPSYYETMTIDSVASKSGSNDLLVGGLNAQPLTLLPREGDFITVSLKPSVAGIFKDTAVVYGSFGAIYVPVSAIVSNRFELLPENGLWVNVLDTVRIPFNLDLMNNNQLGSLNINVNYNSTALKPISIESAKSGTVPLNSTLSNMTITTPGIVELNLVWQSPLTKSGAAFDMLFQALLGNTNRPLISLEKPTNEVYCISTNIVTVNIDGRCGGKSGFLSKSSDFWFSLSKTLIGTNNLDVDVYKSKTGSVKIRIFNTYGEVVFSEQYNVSEGGSILNLELPILADGVYICSVASDGGSILNMPFMIVK
jgi:hypothetical protein